MKMLQQLPNAEYSKFRMVSYMKDPSGDSRLFAHVTLSIDGSNGEALGVTLFTGLVLMDSSTMLLLELHFPSIDEVVFVSLVDEIDDSCGFNLLVRA